MIQPHTNRNRSRKKAVSSSTPPTTLPCPQLKAVIFRPIRHFSTVIRVGNRATFHSRTSDISSQVCPENSQPWLLSQTIWFQVEFINHLSTIHNVFLRIVLPEDMSNPTSVNLLPTSAYPTSLDFLPLVIFNLYNKLILFGDLNSCSPSSSLFSQIAADF